MEIDRQILINLLEAFVDVAEVRQREAMLYQMLFTSACKAKGLDENAAKQIVDRARIDLADRITKANQPDYLDLVAKLPQIVDILGSDQNAALRLLKEWKPVGPPH
jgi:hypothetical protein